MKYYKIILAEIGGYVIAWYVVTYIFLGPLPVVSPAFKKNIASSPRIISEKAVEIAGIVREKVSGTFVKKEPVDEAYIPEPWVMVFPTPMGGRPTDTPTPIPTSLPIPTDVPLPTGGGSSGGGGGGGNSGQPFPTQRPRPTRVPKPTQIPQPTDIPEPTAPVTLEEKEQATLTEINRVRQEAGAGPVSVNSSLSQAAHAHGAWMGGGTGLSRCGHTGEGGSDPLKRARAAGYRGGVGEIVSCGWRTPQLAVQGWMNSPNHKAIMLDPSNTEIGIGWGGNMVVAMLGG